MSVLTLSIGCLFLAFILIAMFTFWSRHDGSSNEGSIATFFVHGFPAILASITGIIFSIIGIFTNVFWLQIVLLAILGTCIAWPVFWYLFLIGYLLKEAYWEEIRDFKNMFKS